MNQPAQEQHHRPVYKILPEHRQAVGECGSAVPRYHWNPVQPSLSSNNEGRKYRPTCVPGKAGGRLCDIVGLGLAEMAF